MSIDFTKLFLFLAGIALIAYGYHLLGVAPETALELVITEVKHGLIAVFLGGACVVIAMLRKS